MPYRHIAVMFLRQPGDQEGPVTRRSISASLLSFLALLAPLPVLAQSATGADPAGSGPIVAAMGWLQGTLLGNVATAVAVMAVAAVGFMMLTGRMNWRFGATVIIGCFILFGAGAIVTGIQSAAG
jgi:type IV secretion system protein VirB2